MQPGQCFLQPQLSVKQLKFDIYTILCQYSYHSFIWGSKNKNKFGEINISDSNLLSSGYGNESWLWKIYHTEYGPFLATDWLKTKGSGRVMG